VLVSICQQKGNRFDAVLGIGLNRLHLSLPEQAIALADIIPQPPDLSAVLAELLMAWHRWKVVLMSEEGRDQVRVAWLERALWMNAPVRVLLQNTYFNGVFVGITSSGLLRVATNDGEKIFAAGEVKLRPLD
jgi:BirA family biotin operon repressor/biotin-[acetyl-CoA-carboxylase] ligase